MSVYKINLIVWGSILIIAAIFVIPFFLLDIEGFLKLMPFLMTGLFAVIILIVAIVLYKVFIGAGRKKAATIEAGEDAEATIVSVEDTGVTLQNGLYFQVRFGLEVRPLAGPAFTASAKDYVSRVSISQYQPGTVVSVKYNPLKHEEVAIVGLAGKPQAGTVATGEQTAVTPGERTVFASDAGGQGVTPAPASGRFFSRGKLMVMIGIPLIVSVIALVLPLLALSKKDAIADFFIEKTVGKYEITGATVTDHYTPPEKTVFKPGPGKKWVMVTITVKNTGDKQMNVTGSQLKLDTQDGLEYAPNIVVDTGNDFDSRSLAAGASLTGNLVYEIPEASVPAAIKNIFGDTTPLPAAGS
jgi:hypothetical protein